MSPLSAVSAGSFQDAISTSCAVTNMLVSRIIIWCPVVLHDCLHAGLRYMHGTLGWCVGGLAGGMYPLVCVHCLGCYLRVHPIAIPSLDI